MFTIHSTMSVHEEGTKFYQIYAIYPDVALRPAVAVTHWGKYNTGADMVPAAHGQCETFTTSSKGAANSKMRDMIGSKRKRGYVNWTEKKQEFTDLNDFHSAMKGTFNGKLAPIWSHLTPAIDADLDFNPAKRPKKATPKKKEEPIEQDEPINRGEEWGSF